MNFCCCHVVMIDWFDYFTTSRGHMLAKPFLFNYKSHYLYYYNKIFKLKRKMNTKTYFSFALIPFAGLFSNRSTHKFCCLAASFFLISSRELVGDERIRNSMKCCPYIKSIRIHFIMVSSLAHMCVWMCVVFNICILLTWSHISIMTILLFIRNMPFVLLKNFNQWSMVVFVYNRLQGIWCTDEYLRLFSSPPLVSLFISLKATFKRNWQKNLE